jgi:hypothetical protein
VIDVTRLFQSVVNYVIKISKFSTAIVNTAAVMIMLVEIAQRPMLVRNVECITDFKTRLKKAAIHCCVRIAEWDTASVGRRSIVQTTTNSSIARDIVILSIFALSAKWIT